MKKYILLFELFLAGIIRAQNIPLVYDVENTGTSFPSPVLPDLGQLPVMELLPNPFMWSDGSGYIASFADWSRRRAEIGIEIQHYEIGQKPIVSRECIQSELTDDTLRVTVTVGDETLTLVSRIIYPEGDGPFPAIIGIGRGSGSLPAELFTKRNIAQIAFDFRQVMSHTQTRGKEPINRLYPELVEMGAYAAWSWGISRLIDGLEKLGPRSHIDLKHLAVSGCSFAGKMALFAGSFCRSIR